MNYRFGIYKTLNIVFKSRQFSSKVPTTPIVTLEKEENKELATVNEHTIALLERLSLVKFDTKDGVKVLEDSINFANKILHINTDNIEPLYTVLEKENLSLRQDKVTQGACQADILKNATLVEDDYFVAPPGNIPLHEVSSEEKEHSALKHELRDQKNSVLKHSYTKDQKAPYGFIEHSLSQKEVLLSKDNDVYDITNPTELKLHLIYPKQDIMQYFIKWQRYRKYWWSSITTTPSLFSINDMVHEDNTINVNIVANFSWCQQVVENLSLTISDDTLDNNSHLICKMGVENALFTIILDALSNGTKEGYLRLHSKMAPFKFSFALRLEEEHSKQNKTLVDLANLINYKLKLKKISTWLPKFSLQIQDQIQENLQLGIPYTVILNETTLKNGILHLLNSSTMLKEQVHIADLENYAQTLCN